MKRQDPLDQRPAERSPILNQSGDEAHLEARRQAARRRSEQRLAQIERRKARNRALSLTMLVMLIMLLTVVAIILVMRQAKPRPRFVFIQSGEITHKIRANGLIARDEQLFHAPGDGTLKPLASEGSRAAKGQKLAMIIPAGREEDLKTLQKVEKDIVDLQNELMQSGKGAGARAIYDESSVSLAAVINLIRNDANRSNLSNILAYQTALTLILDQRTARLMDIDFQDARLTELKQTRISLEQSLGLGSGTLICQKPGLVSYKLDGLEAILNTTSLRNLPAGDIRTYLADSQAVLAVNLSVQADSPVLRITAGLYQSLAFILPGVDPKTFPIDSVHTISLAHEGVTIGNCRVVRSERVGTDALIVLTTDRRVEWLSDRRLVQADLVLMRTTGLKVPASALIDYDQAQGRATIMLVNNGFTRLCRVHVLDYDRESAIIQGVAGDDVKPEVSTILVVNPDSIEAGEFIGNG
jgi:hypothetical protein